MIKLSAYAIPVLSLFLAACGKSEPDDGEVQIGDGVGTHPVSLETRITNDIKQLIANGADPKKTHMVEHHLAARTLDVAKKIVEWGKENGFDTTEIDEGEVVSGQWIHVDLVKATKLEVNPIWFDSEQIETLAASLDCEYDGWGCEIVE